jgi:inosine/xanthosine triphosphatase
MYTNPMSAQKMRIIVTSLNPVKIGAVKTAFQKLFPTASPEFIPVSVPSGVSSQPMTDAETRLGAHNRVANARKTIPDADFWVGLEGGLDLYDGQLMASAWMAVCNDSGRVSDARSATLPLPPAVQQLVLNGLELGEANDRVFATINSKQGGGAFGLLTNGLYTRESIYTQTLVLALIPFAHELWRDC